MQHRCRSDYELNCPSTGYETVAHATAKNPSTEKRINKKGKATKWG